MPSSEEEVQVLSPVDFGGLVTRAVSQEDEGLREMRLKARDAGVVRRKLREVGSSREQCAAGVKTVLGAREKQVMC